MNKNILGEIPEEILTHILEFKFEDIVHRLYKQEVKKFDYLNQEILFEVLSSLFKVMEDVCEVLQKNPIKSSRPNEVGNLIEPFVIDSLIKFGFSAATPTTLGGKKKSAGYPDIQANWKGIDLYIEVKTYAKKSKESAFRTFYFSPSKDPKVSKPAHHLLVGFEVSRNENLYTPNDYEIVDLYGMRCKLKLEFNASNNTVYEQNRLLDREDINAENKSKLL